MVPKSANTVHPRNKTRIDNPRNCSRRADQNHFADALGSLKSEHSIELIANVLTGGLSPERIIDRILTAITASDIIPSSELLDALRIECTKKDTRFEQETRHSFCFAFGGLIGNLHQNNQHSEANEHIQYVHRALGLHDPWEYRRKRSFMSESECIEHDLEKVVLLETLGNAGLSSSYEYIASHINSTNSQWVKRAGIFALRRYHDKQTLDTLHKVAISDDEEVVRYEAVQQYQSHPLAVKSMDTTNVVTHDVSKRSIFDKSLAFKLETPGVNWKKEIGSKTIGASFGLIIENLLDLQGSIDIRVHDEAYGIVHLGFLGLNFEFFVARVCFKGGAKYNLNILKDIENVFQRFKKFAATVKNVISAIRKGVTAFEKILNSDGSIKDVVERFVDALEELPDKHLDQCQGTKRNITRSEISYIHIRRYEDAKSLVARILGTNCHPAFPKTKRVSGGGCNGDGFYPARLRNGGPEYTNDGIDILIDENNNDRIIKAGFIVGINGRRNEDTSQTVPTDGTDPPQGLAETQRPGADIDDMKGDPNSIYSATKKGGRRPKRFLKSIGSSFKTMLENIKVFLKKLKIRQMKMGDIIDFLDVLGLDKTKQGLANLMKTVKNALDNDRCNNPEFLTDDELEAELQNRGLQPTQSREEMIQQLKQPDTKCPLMTLSMPDSKMLYCTMDDMCLGIECCMTIEVFDILAKTFKAFMRYDPDVPLLTFGFEDWIYEIAGPALGGDDEQTVKTDIKFDFLEENNLIIKYAFKLRQKNLQVTFGAGMCNPDDTEDCFAFFYVLKDAIIPYPTVHANGTITFPETCSVYNETVILPNVNNELLYNYIQNDCMRIEACIDIEIPLTEYTKSFRAFISLDPCNYVLTASFEKWSTEIIIFDYEWGCPPTLDISNVVPDSLKNILRCQLSDDCFGIRCCIDLTFQIPLSSVQLTVEIPIWFGMDPCEFTVQAGIADLKFSEQLLRYNWDFSLDDWLQEKGSDISSELSEAGAQALFQKLGISEFLKSPPCDRSREPYMPSINGWSNQCPANITNVQLIDNTVCRLNKTCTAFDCCFYVPFLKRTIQVALNIDFCKFEIHGNLETLSFKLPIFDYKWGMIIRHRTR
ncbi:hypothetical protein MAR_021482 [Mya arenaria]|uniref:Uncharacterized protein n=1 Tax=Mya arenaria TaxID=6604 RepID=A0ABY7EBN6_MYAAR|nr:hypothetical protein MAR_021482 [Mya arenaria]